jgi:hypothetical protein
MDNKNKLSVEFIYCGCGCGFTRSKYDNKGIKRNFIDHHHTKNKHYNNGKKHWNWKGGKIIDSCGYILIYKPNHPKSNNNGYIKEHRYVYEQYYNCCLLDWIHIHHIDENKQNNNINNLLPMTINDHSRIHNIGNKNARKNK